MPEAQDASAYVYQGLWSNWSRGQVYGATLTLSPGNTLILISVVAIFIQLIGSQLWRLSQLALHQFRSKSLARDGLYHQQQVVLRNSATDLSTFWQLLRIAIAWRHQKKTKSFQRSIGLLAWCILHSICFAVAGAFSSALLEASDEVLSRSPFCGKINTTYYNSMSTPTATGITNDLAIEYDTNIQARLQQSQQYVQFCTEPSAICKGLPKQQLAWNWTVAELCPFQPGICSETNNKSIVFDTGLLSSHQDLGINAPEQDRVFYRKVTTCTTLNDAEYISDWKSLPATADSPAKQVVDAYYGPSSYGDRNATYSFSEWKQYYSYDQYSDTDPYSINVQLGVAGDITGEQSDFVPIAGLARSDADLMLVFLSFSKAYDSPVSDPWFSAEQAEASSSLGSSTYINGTVYTRQRPVTTLACTEQHQVCIQDNDPSSGGRRCTPLSGATLLVGGPDGYLSLRMTDRQIVTFGRVFQSGLDSSFYRILHFLAQRDPPILARRLIQGLIGSGLPDDQWQQETIYWHSIAMANLQRRVLEYSTGQFVASTDYVNTTASPVQKWLCQNQIIRGTDYRSFSFFALMLITILGLVTIIAGLTIEDCMAVHREKKLRRRGGYGDFRQDMWVKNEMLEMLRLLYERDAETIWSHSANGIPVSAPGQLMKIAQLQKSGDIKQSCDAKHQHEKQYYNESYASRTSTDDITLNGPESREGAASVRGWTSYDAGQVPWDEVEMERYGLESRSQAYHRIDLSQ